MGKGEWARMVCINLDIFLSQCITCYCLIHPKVPEILGNPSFALNTTMPLSREIYPLIHPL